MARIRTISVLLAVALLAGVGARTTAAAASPQPLVKAAVSAPACKRGYYKNSSGHCVKRPAKDPSGATARCRDGTYSYSEHASGTCSHHGGVQRWIRHP